MTRPASALSGFADLIAATAQVTDLSPALIEKDYYVVRALRAIVDRHGTRFLFKGGTSLSKGWPLLDRFSEDIDLLPRTQEQGRPIFKGEVDRHLKAAEDCVAEASGFHARRRGVEQRRPPRILLRLPADPPHSGWHGRPDQAGNGHAGRRAALGGAAVRSFAGEFAAAHGQADLAGDLAPFDVDCLDVTRTLVEKLFAIHAVCAKDHGAGKTRHYYDLYRLLALEEVQRFLSGPEYPAVWRDVLAFSRASWPNAPVPDAPGFSGSGALHPDEEGRITLARHFASDRRLSFRPPPTLDAILERLQMGMGRVRSTGSTSTITGREAESGLG